MFHIIDFGSRKIPFIVGMIEALGFPTKVHPWENIDRGAMHDAKAIIMSGSPTYLTEVDHTPYHERCSFIKEIDIPVLGICFGQQVIGILHGAKIYRGPEVRAENPIHVLKKDPLFTGLDDGVSMNEDHTEGINLPEGFIHLASSATYANEAMKHPTQKIWGIQFHPEVSGDKGLHLFRNFCTHCV
ncbi:MAG: gamma-glutamyl-gamma-aminobutyrate hydrolase family protein [Bacteroidia bacterium]